MPGLVDKSLRLFPIESLHRAPHREDVMRHHDRMRFTRYHLLLWGVLWILSGLIAIRVCITYNEIAGTDKTPQHIAAIAIGTVFGPMVGPFANSGNIGAPISVLVWTGALIATLVASALPFVWPQRPVARWIHGVAWCGFFVASAVWFGAAIFSLGYYLS